MRKLAVSAIGVLFAATLLLTASGESGADTVASTPSPAPDCYVAADPTPGGPAAPNGLIAIQPIGGVDDAELVWTDASSDETCFVIESRLAELPTAIPGATPPPTGPGPAPSGPPPSVQGMSTATDWKTLGFTEVDVQEFHDLGPHEENSYICYRVYAANATGRSEYSTEDCAFLHISTPTPSPKPTPSAPPGCYVSDEPTPGRPAAPTDLTAWPRLIAPDGGFGELSWTDNSGDETCFVVEAAFQSGFRVVAFLPPATTDFEDGPYPEGSSVSWRVYAATQTARSEYSNGWGVQMPFFDPTPTPTPAVPLSAAITIFHVLDGQPFVASYGPLDKAFVGDKVCYAITDGDGMGGLVTTVNWPWGRGQGCNSVDVPVRICDFSASNCTEEFLFDGSDTSVDMEAIDYGLPTLTFRFVHDDVLQTVTLESWHLGAGPRYGCGGGTGDVILSQFSMYTFHPTSFCKDVDATFLTMELGELRASFHATGEDQVVDIDTGTFLLTPTPTPSHQPSSSPAPTSTPASLPHTGGPPPSAADFGLGAGTIAVVVVVGGALVLARRRAD